MKRILNTETENYTPYKRTPLSPNPTYFSVFEGESGWDEIRYYIDKHTESKNIFTKDEVNNIIEDLKGK